MKKSYNFVFDPFILPNGLQFKNRIVFTSMGVDLGLQDGSVSSDLCDFYEGIARGGVDAFVLGNSSVTSRSRLHPKGLLLDHTRHVKHLSKLISVADKWKCPAIVQLQHYGPQGSPEVSGFPLLAPSVTEELLKNNPLTYREMSLADIKGSIDQFAYSAKLAKSAGARIIQIQAANGYLISRFLSPYSNQRVDEYGGNLPNRARFLLDIIDAMKSVLRYDTLITVRLNVNDVVESGGISLADVAFIIDRLDELGVSLIELSACVRSSFDKLLSPATCFIKHFRDDVSSAKKNSRLPILFAGGTPDVKTANFLLKNDNCDLVGMTRAIFADNDLVNKTIAGAETTVNQCLFDGNCFRDKSNPAADRVYCCVSQKYPRPGHIIY